MKKSEATRAVIDAFDDRPIVFSTGYISRIAHDIQDSDNHFYMVGSMGLASSIGVGIAATTGREVVVVDGDGSALMGLNGLLLHEDVEPPVQLVHVVLDDGEYDSTGGQPGPLSVRRLPDLARAAGYGEVHRVATLGDLSRVLRLARTAPPGRVWMLHCKVEPAHAAPPRLELGLPDIFERLREYLSGGRQQLGTGVRP